MRRGRTGDGGKWRDLGASGDIKETHLVKGSEQTFLYTLMNALIINRISWAHQDFPSIALSFYHL